MLFAAEGSVDVGVRLPQEVVEVPQLQLQEQVLVEEEGGGLPPAGGWGGGGGPLPKE